MNTRITKAKFEASVKYYEMWKTEEALNEVAKWIETKEQQKIYDGLKLIEDVITKEDVVKYNKKQILDEVDEFEDELDNE